MAGLIRGERHAGDVESDAQGFAVQLGDRKPKQHRVAVGIEAHREVLRHDARIGGFQPERGLVRRAVDPLIGDRHRPVEERFAQMDIIHEPAADQEVRLRDLHPRLDLALRLGAVGPAEARIEAPVLRERLEGGRRVDFAGTLLGDVQRLGDRRLRSTVNSR